MVGVKVGRNDHHKHHRNVAADPHHQLGQEPIKLHRHGPFQTWRGWETERGPRASGYQGNVLSGAFCDGGRKKRDAHLKPGKTSSLDEHGFNALSQYQIIWLHLWSVVAVINGHLTRDQKRLVDLEWLSWCVKTVNVDKLYIVYLRWWVTVSPAYGAIHRKAVDDYMSYMQGEFSVIASWGKVVIDIELKQPRIGRPPEFLLTRCGDRISLYFLRGMRPEGVVVNRIPKRAEEPPFGKDLCSPDGDAGHTAGVGNPFHGGSKLPGITCSR
ncbi:hypothetical protein CDAR_184951 [Caerostris darwini]|uniref:Uncharacterized protein n=1 Tax=Caerostris darwini TaxID=1538125 RepID=A0AAV4SQS6_9ARAC|nr:hypothetical protein CDAR_184951 [Caerostris darwini]